MSEKLLENSFLTTNLSNYFSKATDGQSTNNTPAAAAKITDWGKELAKRLEANSKLSGGAKVPESQVEDKFWQDFFMAKWPEDIAKKLIQFDNLLRRDIKILKFNSKTNPLLAFLLQSYVQKNLLATDLLNSATFKAIHKVLSDELVADEYFYKTSKFNILYCIDLYKKTPADMVTYFTEQNKILSASNLSDEEKGLINLQVLIQQSNRKDAKSTKTATQSNAKLNDFATITAKLEKLSLSSSASKGSQKNSEKDSSEQITASSKDLAQLAQKIKSKGQAYAMLQLLCLTSDSSAAVEALKSNAFSSVTTSEISAATSTISKQFKGKKFTQTDADTLATFILKILNNL